LIKAAVDTIADVGAASMSVREVARRAGVSHTAATYHFGDKAGLLTAVAAEGYRLLGVALLAAQQEHQSFLEVGVAYVRFAITHQAHFDVMFQPALYQVDDPALQDAKRETAALLYGTADVDAQQLVAGVAAWSLVHGLAVLWLNGNIPPQLADDPEATTRLVAPQLRVPRR
jgi:AcrR family transcriptional regulator